MVRPFHKSYRSGVLGAAQEAHGTNEINRSNETLLLLAAVRSKDSAALGAIFLFSLPSVLFSGYRVQLLSQYRACQDLVSATFS